MYEYLRIIKDIAVMTKNTYRNRYSQISFWNKNYYQHSPKDRVICLRYDSNDWSDFNNSDESWVVLPYFPSSAFFDIEIGSDLYKAIKPVDSSMMQKGMAVSIVTLPLLGFYYRNAIKQQISDYLKQVSDYVCDSNQQFNTIEGENSQAIGFSNDNPKEEV